MIRSADQVSGRCLLNVHHPAGANLYCMTGQSLHRDRSVPAHAADRALIAWAGGPCSTVGTPRRVTLGAAVADERIRDHAYEHALDHGMGAGLRRVDLAGAAHLVLADGVAYPDPQTAVCEAMLEGCDRQ
jgi:hypothetical protein